MTAGLIALIDRLRRQMDEERTSSNNENANEEALVKYTRRLTSATWVIAIAAILSFGAALLQWHVLGTTDDKIGRQLSVLETNQRPWMKIETVKAYSSPLTTAFDGLRFNGPKGAAFLPLHIMLKNVGQTPAFDVRASIGELFDGKLDPKELKERERKNCEALDNAFPPVPLLVDNTTYIRAIFPNDEAPYDSLALALSPEEIAKYSGPDGVNKTFQLWFYGCIRYTFASASEPHQTMACLHLRRMAAQAR